MRYDAAARRGGATIMKAIDSNSTPRAARRALATALLVLATAAGCGGRPDTSTLPNVLLVTLDTTRADRLSVYGAARPTSPQLERLAARGALFLRCQAQATVTPVSHASILTGQNPYQHGLRYLHAEHGYALPDEAESLAETLAARGFDTAAFVSAFPAGRRFGLEQGFQHFDDAFAGQDESAVGAGGRVNTGRSQRTARATNGAVFRWLERPRTAALFLWVHYFDPHDVKLLPEDPADLRAFRAGAEPGGATDQKQRLIDYYDGELLYMDREIGRLVARLEREGRPLLVAVVGDHGEGLGDHDWWSHGILYQEQARVPFLLAGPGVPQGLRVASVVRSIDVAPTLLALLGLPGSRRPQDGVDLSPLFRPGAAPADLVAYAESTTLDMSYEIPHQNGAFDRKERQLFSLVRGQLKYIHHRGAPEQDELFDLDADPLELKNLAGEQPETLARFRQELLALDPYPPDAATGAPPSAEDLERLRELGYLGGGR